MSGVRSITRRPTVVGYATPTSCPIYDKSGTNTLFYIPAGTGSTEIEIADVSSTQTFTNKTLTTPTIASSATTPYVKDVTGAGGYKAFGGSGALVTGTLTVATGLTQIVGASANFSAQATGTGVASNQLLGVTFTTGSLLITAYSVSSVTGATVAANTATGGVTYFVYGT